MGRTFSRNRLRWQIGLVLIAAALLTFMTSTATQAQGPAPTNTPRLVSDNEVNALSKTIFCPVCENVPLEVCETQACVRWRTQVRDLLSQGYTDVQVRQYFVDNFGTQTVGVTHDPLAQTLTVVLPLILIALIGVVVAARLFSQRGRVTVANHDDNSAIQSATLTDDYRARLEEELRKRE